VLGCACEAHDQLRRSGSYHFYFGDARGTPGTILTFSPGLAPVAALAAPAKSQPQHLVIHLGSVDYWLERLKENQVSAERAARRFGEEVIRFSDLDGMRWNSSRRHIPLTCSLDK